MWCVDAENGKFTWSAKLKFGKQPARRCYDEPADTRLKLGI
jgi:hypothetical protein